MTRYLATVLAGLEGVAAGELGTKVASARIAERHRGRFIFEVDALPTDLLALRTIDNLFAFLGTIEAGPHRTHLPALGRAAASMVGADLPAVVRRFAVAEMHRDPKAQAVTLWTNASRVGKQTYSRFEAAHAVTEAVVRRHPTWRLGTADEHTVELRLDVEGTQATLSARLTAPEFRFRGAARGFSPAALRPPVAHALVWLSGPEAGDVFLDPFCGSGTILAERAAYPARALLGSDASAEALAIARRNLPMDDDRVRLERWDARRLPLDSGSVTALVSNLPFGQQVLSLVELPALYLAFTHEVQRLLAPGGQSIVLTDQVDTLLAAVEKTRLQATRVLTLSLKGLHPEALRLTLP